MSPRELERVDVMGRIAKGGLKLLDAAIILQLSYRQVKRLWRRYQEVGREGLKHGHAGRASNRGKPMKQRRRVLNLNQEKVLRFGGGAIRPDPRRRALGGRRWHRSRPRDVAPLDVGGAPMDSAAQEKETLPTEGTEGTFRRAGAVGWKFSRLARRPWSTRLSHEHGGRCHEP